MINIVKIKGGLGNQMFGYAFFLAIKDAQKFSFTLIDIEETVNKHFGLEIFKIFHCKGLWRYKAFCLLHKLHPYFWKKYNIITQKNSLYYDKNYLNKSDPNVYYDGYWQSEKYFSNISKTIRNHFRFKESLLNTLTKGIEKIIQKQNSVSIHIRRGDYLNEIGWDTCNIDYYNRAIEYINRSVTNCKFYIFSDDIIWCKEQFNNTDYSFINWNTNEDSWQDMYLMSICKHNIIANSTFSWWGAWLNSNPLKIVIAPKVWFKDRDNNDCHIVPNNWIKI